MKSFSKIFFVFVASVLTLTACNGSTTQPTPTVTPTTGLPDPVINIESVPDVEQAAVAYLDLWIAEDYAAMYDRLSQLTKDAVSMEEFEQSHRNTAIKLTMQSLDYSVLSRMVNPMSAQISYEIRYQTALMNEISRDTIMNLTLEDGAWHVQWEPGMMLPELTGGNYLELVIEVPARGNIYSSDASENYPLVSFEDAVTVMVTPGKIVADSEGRMVSLLAEMFDRSEASIYAEYENTADYQYSVIGDVTLEVANQYYDRLTRYDAISLSNFRSRFYHDGGIAPHVTGFVLTVPAEELEKYQRLGYTGEEKIGASGLEAWGEQYLAGKHGADLYVKDPQGQVLTKIASSAAEPAQSIYTTIDSAYQYRLQQSFGDNVGAMVVMERDTGKVIALVSVPGYDPNVFIAPSYTAYSIAEITQDPLNPMYNRATQGVYPPGSVFKIITMAAALETGVYQPTSSYYCDSYWRELTGWVGEDWTVSHGDGPSGQLTLQEGLMRSCNPWFWHIAYSLWNEGYRTSIPDVAIDFGLGKTTGIEIPDFAGSINPSPTEVSEYVQMAIGQSTLQVSPLQVAAFAAAVGNGGTLYQPTLVEKIGLTGQTPVYTFEPKVVRQLNVEQSTLEAIQEAMVWVVNNSRGTAQYNFRNYPYKIAGKTGTAENPLGKSHAWFAGYTFQNDPDHPDIAVAIILENAGEGSEMAAPLFRRAVSLYFSDGQNAGGTMPWEDSPYIPAAPEEE